MNDPNHTRRSFLKQMAVAGVAAVALPRASRAADDFLRRFNDGRDWFGEKRFGMFIHWGIYSVPGWHEQHMYRTQPLPARETSALERPLHRWLGAEVRLRPAACRARVWQDR